MKKCYTLLLILLCCTDLSFAAPGFADNFSLVFINPQSRQRYTGGGITNSRITVTPVGLYAKVELIFTIEAPAAATSNTEALMTFTLPANSFVQDSWLWLNDTIIIRAGMYDRGLAQNIYQGIVNRNRDPSILINTTDNNYSLNVFPITASYKRKVKVEYAVPFRWLDGKATIALPNEFFPANLLVNTTQQFSNPSMAEASFNSMTIAYGSGQYSLAIPASAVGNELSLRYNTPYATTAFMNFRPISANDGIYQLLLPPDPAAAAPPQYYNFVLDAPGSMSYSWSVYALPALKSKLKSFLLTQLRPIDSFNIFYANTGQVRRASTGWLAADSTQIVTAFNAMPTTISNETALFESLLKTAVAFTQSRPGSHAQTVMISSNTDYLQQAKADTLVKHVRDYVVSFSNKVSIINYAFSTYQTTQNVMAGSDYLYSKLAQATGGISLKANKQVYDNYTGTNVADLDLHDFLQKIVRHGLTYTANYSLNTTTSGFNNFGYGISTANRIYPGQAYTETGRYFGSMGNVISLDYMGPSGIVSKTYSVSNIQQDSSHYQKAWVFHYIKDLIATGSSVIRQEVIDSSKNNRVLCDYTAFLALETGDTIKTGKDGNGYPISVNSVPPSLNISVFPNPFTSTFTIESTEAMDELLLLDITGKIVWTKKFDDQKTKYFQWNSNLAGSTLAPGIYILKVVHNGHVTVHKLTKS